MYKKEKGISLSSIVLIMLIVILVAFLIYEIVYIDVLDIFKRNATPIETLGEIGEIVEQNVSVADVANETEQEVPILDQDLLAQEGTDTEYIRYYYNQLDDNAKIIYDGIEENIKNMRTGTYKINFEKKFNDLLHESDGEQKLNIAFQSAWNAFTYDYVDVFYIDVTKLVLTTQTTSIGNFSTHEVYLSNGSNESYLAEGFTYELLNTEIKRIENLRNQVVERLEGYSTHDKIKHVHNWLIDNLSYDTTYQNKNIYDIYGALTYASAVCEGYARAYKYMLDALGITSVLVSGTATNSEGLTETHAWNDIKIDDKWYAIDLTWDDPILRNGSVLTDTSRYKNFLKGSDTFYQNHKEDGNLSDNSIIFEFPKLEKDDY